MVPGTGTAINVIALTIGCSIGLFLRGRFPERIQHRATDAIGLFTIVVGGISAGSVLDPELAAEVGPSAPVLIILASLLIGAIFGAILRLEDRLEAFGGWAEQRIAQWRSGIRPKASRPGEPAAAAQGSQAVQGFITGSVVFCAGPMTVVGALQDGLGQGVELLTVKSMLDFFASIAFTATMGAGVFGSIATIIVFQGSLTFLGVVVGEVMTPGQVSALSAVGGIVLMGLGIRLLKLRQLAIVEALPSLLIAPILVAIVAAVQRIL